MVQERAENPSIRIDGLRVEAGFRADPRDRCQSCEICGREVPREVRRERCEEVQFEFDMAVVVEVVQSTFLQS
jgi:hypothetical protein